MNVFSLELACKPWNSHGNENKKEKIPTLTKTQNILLESSRIFDSLSAVRFVEFWVGNYFDYHHLSDVLTL